MKNFLLLALILLGLHIPHIEAKIKKPNESTEIPQKILDDLFCKFTENDPDLANYLQDFSLKNYKLIFANNQNKFSIERNPQCFIKKNLAKTGKWEQKLQNEMSKYVKPGSIVIDAGGHIGVHTINLSHAVGSGVVHVFEPQLKLFVENVINMHLNGVSNVVFHRQALGNITGVVEISNPENECLGKIDLSGSSGKLVPINRIDSFNLDNVSLIKIDVEGFEMEVFEGARQTILKNKPIIFIEITSSGKHLIDPQLHKKIQNSRIKTIENMGYTVHLLGGIDYLCIPVSS